MSRTLLNLSLAASFLSPGAFAAEPEPQPVIISLSKDAPVIDPAQVQMQATAGIAPLTVILNATLFGRKDEKFVFCSQVGGLADLHRLVTPEGTKIMNANHRKEIDSVIEDGQLKFAFAAGTQPVEMATYVNTFKDAATAQRQANLMQMSRDAEQICRTPLTSPASPWHRKPF